MTNRMQDKVVLVTGGASGIGRATCELLAKEGAWVFVADRLRAQAQETASAIHATGGRAEALSLDVTRPQDWANAVSRLLELAGRIDVLINNAGILVMKPVQDTSSEEWDQVLDVNLKGVFLGQLLALVVGTECDLRLLQNLHDLGPRDVALLQLLAKVVGGEVISFHWVLLSREYYRNALCPALQRSSSAHTMHVSEVTGRC